MRVSAADVAELLGSRLLELLYFGTDDLLQESARGRPVCRPAAPDNGGHLDELDPLSLRIYQNLRYLSQHLHRTGDGLFNELRGCLSTLDPCSTALDRATRDYVNGRHCKSDAPESAKESTSGPPDRSLKGSVDVLLIPMLHAFMKTGRFVSTSSCSGRIVLFEHNAAHATCATKRSQQFGRAGRFLYTSHCHLDCEELDEVCRAVSAPVRWKRECYHKSESLCVSSGGEAESADGGDSHSLEPMECEVRLKFEGFVLHVECASMRDAAELLQVCRSCGLKQSGIISCTKRFIVSIRDTNILEAPVALRRYPPSFPESNVSCDPVVPAVAEGSSKVQTKWLVSDDYFRYLLNACNQKLSRSIRQMVRLYWGFSRHFGENINLPKSPDDHFSTL